MFNLIKPFVLLGFTIWIAIAFMNLARAGNLIAAAKAGVATIVVWVLVGLVMIAANPTDFVDQYKQRKNAERTPLVEEYTYWKKRCETAGNVFKESGCQNAAKAKKKLDDYDQKQ